MSASNSNQAVSRRAALAALAAAGIGASLTARSVRADHSARPLVARIPERPASTNGGAQSEATPAPAEVVALVLDAALLRLQGGTAVSGHLIDQPGWSQTISFPETSVAIVHVARGAYTVRSDGPLAVVRPSSDGVAVAERIPPGVEATAQSGETMLYLSSSHIEESNLGDEPTDRYTFIVVGAGEPTIEHPQGVSTRELLAAIEPAQWSSLPGGQITITFVISDSAASGGSTPISGLQMAGELEGSPPQRLVISVTPGVLPGATLVDLSSGE